MPRCICLRDCQVRVSGKIQYFARNDIAEFAECPEYFSVLGERAEKVDDNGLVDFDQIPREELLEMDGDVEKLKAFLKARHPDVGFAANIGWDTLIFRYIEARELKTTIVDNTGRRPNTIVEIKRAEAEASVSTGDDELDSILNS